MTKTHYAMKHKTITIGSETFRLFDIDLYGKAWKIFLSAAEYADGRLAVVINHVCDDEIEEFAVATVNLGDHLDAPHLAYADTNNCPWLFPFLTQNGLAEMTGRFARSGFCIYPLMRWNTDAFTV